MLHVWNLMFQHLNPNMTQINGYAMGMPQSLLGKSAWQAVKPGVILQLLYGTCPSTNISWTILGYIPWLGDILSISHYYIPLLGDIWSINHIYIYTQYILLLLLFVIIIIVIIIIYISHCWVPIYHIMQYPQYLVVKLWDLPEIVAMTWGSTSSSAAQPPGPGPSARGCWLGPACPSWGSCCGPSLHQVGVTVVNSPKFMNHLGMVYTVYTTHSDFGDGLLLGWPHYFLKVTFFCASNCADIKS